MYMYMYMYIYIHICTHLYYKEACQSILKPPHANPPKPTDGSQTQKQFSGQQWSLWPINPTSNQSP